MSEAQIFSAGLLPDPTLSLGFDELLSGPDTMHGFMGQIALSWRYVTGDARAAARTAGEQVRLESSRARGVTRLNAERR